MNRNKPQKSAANGDFLHRLTGGRLAAKNPGTQQITPEDVERKWRSLGNSGWAAAKAPHQDKMEDSGFMAYMEGTRGYDPSKTGWAPEDFKNINGIYDEYENTLNDASAEEEAIKEGAKGSSAMTRMRDLWDRRGELLNKRNAITAGAGLAGAGAFGILAHLLSPEKYRRLATIVSAIGGGVATAAAAHYAQKHFNA